MTVVINLPVININAMETDTGVFIGENSQFGWDSHQKQTSGVGFVFGAFNQFPLNGYLITDNDYFDMPVNDQDIKTGFTNQQY